MGPVVVFGVVYGAAYALLGLGIVLVYKGSRVFNFAQAEFGTVAAFTVYLTHTNGVPYVFAAVIGVLAAVVFGLLLERGVVQPLFNAPKVTLLVATAGIALLSISLQLFIGGATARSYEPAIQGTAFRPFGVALSGQQLLVILVLAGFAAALAVFFRTDLGLAILAVSQEPTATNLSGISVRRISALIWALAALMGGVAGVLAPAIQPGAFTPGYMTNNFLIFAFVAAVIGGMTSLPGAVVGGFVLGLAQQFTFNYIADIRWVETNLPGSPELVTFVLLVTVLAIRPAGLLGREA
jgi:branched-chain amino acid transport system permease protein